MSEEVKHIAQKGKWAKVVNGKVVQVQPHLNQEKYDSGDWFDVSEALPGQQHDIETNNVTTPVVYLSRAQKIEEMRIKCGEVIESGFSSNALGYVCQYRCNRDDQSTMREAHADGGGKIWRNEIFTAHIGSEATQVWAEAKTHILTTREHYASKVAEIENESLTDEQFNAVEW